MFAEPNVVSRLAPRTSGIIIPAFAILACAMSHAQTVSGSVDDQWRSWGHDPGGMRFSPVKQINRANVQQLQRAWTYNVPTTANGWIASLESTPLMVDDVLYFATQTGQAIAVDAESGKELWVFNPTSSEANRRPVPNRGLAYWEGDSPVTCTGGHPGRDKRIFYADLDARLFALDPATGKPCEGFGDRGSINLRKGVADDWPDATYDLTSPPSIYKDLVIAGCELQEHPSKGPSGAVRAFDVRTGRLAWRFDTVPPPGQTGRETWEDEGWKDRSGTNAWPPMSVDVEHGLVFLPLGSPSYDFYGADRKGSGLFGDSLVALDARTGKLQWYFQTVHHDLWDYDPPTQPVLVNVRRSGREIPAVALVTKTGFVFVFNRLTGEPLFPIEERPVPQSQIPGEASWPTQPFPVKPPPLARTSITRDDITTVTPESRKYCLEHFGSMLPGKLFDPWRLTLTLEMPGTLGGANWHGASFDPSSGYLFVNENELGSVGLLKPQPAGSPEAYEWGSPWGSYARFWDDKDYPCQQPPWGTLNAVDLNTGELAWRVPLGVVDELEAKGIPQTGIYSLGGSLATAGGLVFIAGTADHRFRAFDSQTGKELWVTQLESNGHANPITYLGEKSKRQFVVIAVSPGGRFNRDTSAPTVLAAYALFPKGQLSPAQVRLQAQSRTVAAGPGSLPSTITPPQAAPLQPASFSHRVHANSGIKCADCHRPSEGGRGLSIPGVKQCATCHKPGQETSPEIQELAELAKSRQTVSWVRVYQLPGFVSFSHQQHTGAKIDCEVCHGAVATEDVLRQEKDISMIACINCHKLRNASTSCGVCHNIGY
jgi:glucose dehydrogenase